MKKRPRQHRPYTERELAIVLGNQPKTARAKLMALGIERSIHSIRQQRHNHKQGHRGQPRRRRVTFTPEEDAWLRKNYETATPQEIAERFPTRGRDAIAAHARNTLGLRKEKRIRARLPAINHMDLIREIVMRAKEDGISLAALDRETGMKNSYWAYNWQRRTVQLEAIVKAAEFFGARVCISFDWQDA